MKEPNGGDQTANTGTEIQGSWGRGQSSDCQFTRPGGLEVGDGKPGQARVTEMEAGVVALTPCKADLRAKKITPGRAFSPRQTGWPPGTQRGAASPAHPGAPAQVAQRLGGGGLRGSTGVRSEEGSQLLLRASHVWESEPRRKSRSGPRHPPAGLTGSHGTHHPPHNIHFRSVTEKAPVPGPAG